MQFPLNLNLNLNLHLTNIIGRPKLAVGIDIGQRNVKCVQLRKIGKVVQLEKIFMLDLAESNSVYPKNCHLAEKLAAAVEVHGLQDKRVLAAGSSGHVQVLDLQLSAMPKKEMDIVIAKNLEDCLNTPVTELTYVHRILNTEANQLVRVYYSAKQDAIKIVNAMTFASLRPMSLNAGFLAITEMLHFNEYIVPGKAYIVADLGETATCTSVIVGREVVSSHSHPTGFGLINKNIIDSGQFPYAAGEEAKRHLTDLPQIGNQEVETIVDKSYTAILEVLQNAIEFYKEQNFGAPIEGILLTGGGFSYGVIDLILEDYYKIPTKIINPFRNVRTVSNNSAAASPDAIKAFSPFMAAAVGLALGGMDW